MPHKAETTIAETRQVRELYPEASTYEYKQEMKKCSNGLSGATEEFCWEGLPVGPDIFLTQDLLHRCYKFIWDHLSEWLTHIIGEEELDRRSKLSQSLDFKTLPMGSRNCLRSQDVNIGFI